MDIALLWLEVTLITLAIGIFLLGLVFAVIGWLVE